MRDKDIEKRFIEAEKRLDALENPRKIEPINTPEGTKQREEIREKLSKKADSEEKKSSKDIKKVVANILDEGSKKVEKGVENE